MNLDPTKPVQLANGWPAKIYEVFEKENRIVGAYLQRNIWVTSTWWLDGSYSCVDHEYYLINVPEQPKDMNEPQYDSDLVDNKNMKSKYTLTWDFGRHQCGFETTNDVVEFINNAPTKEPKEHEIWVNVYKNALGAISGMAHLSEESAKKYSPYHKTDCIACLGPIKFKEGEGL